MIQIQSQLQINDNSGIKIGQCLKIYKRKTGTIGDIILISVKQLRIYKKKKVKIEKGDLFKALIVHTTFPKQSTIGNYIRFDNNSIVVLNNQQKPLGSRIFGPLTSEVRKIKNFKILSLASNIL